MLTKLGVGIAAEPLLNHALEDDRLDRGYVGECLYLWTILTPDIDSEDLNLHQFRYGRWNVFWSPSDSQ